MTDSMEEKSSQETPKSKSESILDKDIKALEKNVERFLEGKLNPNKPIIILHETPLVLQMLGAKNLPIEISYATLKKIMLDVKKDRFLPKDVVKALPKAMNDPIMVFDSATHGGDLVMMLDLKDQDGATVVVPLNLGGETWKGKKINSIKSVYGQKDSKTKEVRNQWFGTQIINRKMFYQNNIKSREWASSVGLQLPPGGTPTNATIKRVYHYDDLVKFQNQEKELPVTVGKIQTAFEKMSGTHQAHEKIREQSKKRVEGFTWGIELRNKSVNMEPFMNVNDRPYDASKERAFKEDVLQPAARKSLKVQQPQPIGQYRYFAAQVEAFDHGRGLQFSIQVSGERHAPPELRYENKADFNFKDFTQRMDNFMGRFEAMREEAWKKAKQEFPQMEMLKALRKDSHQGMIELAKIKNDPSYYCAWEPKSFALAKKQAQERAKSAAPAKQPELATPKAKDKGMGR